MKFSYLNDECKNLLNSKRNLKSKRRINIINMILKKHNVICWRLKRFNYFWKWHLQLQIINFLILIWFFIYEVFLDTKLVFYNKLFLSTWLVTYILVVSLLIYMLLMVSRKVRYYFYNFNSNQF